MLGFFIDKPRRLRVINSAREYRKISLAHDIRPEYRLVKRAPLYSHAPGSYWSSASSATTIGRGKGVSRCRLISRRLSFESISEYFSFEVGDHCRSRNSLVDSAFNFTLHTLSSRRATLQQAADAAISALTGVAWRFRRRGAYRRRTISLSRTRHHTATFSHGRHI